MKKIPYNISRLISSFFGIGFMPVAGGTFGSIAGAAIYYFLWRREIIFYAVLFFLTLIGFFVSERAELAFGKKDARPIVIDEGVGMLVSLVLVPLNWINFIIVFALFRIFDITKPYPIRRLEKMPAGFGIMLDDIVAGLYANLLFHIGISAASYKFV